MHSLRILIKYAHSQAPVGYPEAMTLCGGWVSAALEYPGKATRLFSAGLVHLHSLNIIIYHCYTTKHVCWVMLSHKVTHFNCIWWTKYWSCMWKLQDA